MTTPLHEAIAAVRAGDAERAQRLAAEAVRSNPADANAWYLLSQLVESDARRAAYLSKTLSLAPNHERARVEFAALPPAVAHELAAPVPPWVAEEVTAVHEPAAAGVAAGGETAPVYEPAVETAGEPAAAPEWLQSLSPEPVAALPVEPVAVETPDAPRPKPAAARPRPAKAKKKNSSNQALSILLGLLMLLTLLVLGVLIYLLIF